MGVFFQLGEVYILRQFVPYNAKQDILRLVLSRCLCLEITYLMLKIARVRMVNTFKKGFGNIECQNLLIAMKV